MPPARKNLYPDNFTKRQWPVHMIDIRDLLRGNEKQIKHNDFHLVVNVDEFTPEKVVLKRSGNTLTIETKHEGNNHGEDGGDEYVKRSYEIPEAGFTKEFGAQLSTNGILSLRCPKTEKPSGPVVYIDQLSKLKPGMVMHYPAVKCWKGQGPANVVENKNMEEEKVMDNGNHPGSDAGPDESVPGDNSENTAEGVIPDEIA